MNKTHTRYPRHEQGANEAKQKKAEPPETPHKGHTLDRSRIPAEISATDSRIGTMYKPVKQRVTIRLDADILDWLRKKTGGKGYQTMLNRVLRERMLQEIAEGEEGNVRD